MDNLNLYDCSAAFMIGSSYLAMCIGYYNRNKFKELKWLFIYPLVSFLQVSFGHFFMKEDTLFPTEEDVGRFNGYGIKAFYASELFLIYYFFIEVLKSATLKRYLYLISGMFGLAVLFNFSNKEEYSDLFFFQSILVLIPCYLYFKNLIRKHFMPNLSLNPTFWVATGITIYFSCTFPLFAFGSYLFGRNFLYNQMLYSINFIFYGVLFLLIARAYLLKKQNN